MISNIIKNIYRKLVKTKKLPSIEYSQLEASSLIEKGLTSPEPFFCGRLGCTELQTIIFAEKAEHFPFNIILQPFWKNVLQSIHNSSGVFNADQAIVYQFAKMYKQLMPEMDVMGSWHPAETFFEKELQGIPRIELNHIGPDITQDSWLRILEGKKILVVHPFAETIKKQYARRQLLFSNPHILPQFKQLIVMKPVQSLSVIPDNFNTWFDALYYMRTEMEKIDYDIALVACGAYGFPLSAWAKQAGKKVVLMGGALQLLFGIKGKRWEEEKSNTVLNVKEYMNQNPYWVHPDKEDIIEYDQNNDQQALKNYI